MKILMFVTIFFILFRRSIAADFKDRKILVTKFMSKPNITKDELEKIREKILKEVTDGLTALPQDIKDELIKQAELSLQKHYPLKLVTDYMIYNRTGKRGTFEGILKEFRKLWGEYLIGHLLDRLTNSSSIKYVDEVLNGVWSTMEDSTWVWPAHLYLQKVQPIEKRLPIPGLATIDLGASEVAKDMAWVSLLLRNQFDGISLVIKKRIDFELKNRIFLEYVSRDDYFWQGFTGSHIVNNWNPWINGNILLAAVFSLDDINLFNEVLNRTIYSTDYFLDSYGDDGGCEEGPAYWRQAGGRFIEFLELLERLYSDAKVFFKSEMLIKAIGDYSYKMCISGDWFVNFADSSARLTYPPSLLAKYGRLFDEEVMWKYSAYMLDFKKSNIAGYMIFLLSDWNEFLNFALLYNEINTKTPEIPKYSEIWLPDIQVATGRADKFYVAAKAGSNHEFHNHNDVGNFILFYNGHPVLIDIGVGTYSAKTFSLERYTIFYMRSGYHSVPFINGQEQKNGDQFKAEDVTFTSESNGFTFSANIGPAYPMEAKVKKWTRSVTLDNTSNTLTLNDKFELEEFKEEPKLIFITLSTVTVTQNADGALLQNVNVSVQMKFTKSDWNFATDKHSLDGDKKLEYSWGVSTEILRINLTSTSKAMTGDFTITFTDATTTATTISTN